ncbi:MAG: 3-deoxy-7-phosphoheptulonate synthase [bacterium]
MYHKTDDLRIASLHPLLPPGILMEELPLTETISSTVSAGRAACENVLRGTDDRLMVVVGPCSIHDPVAAIEYAKHLASTAEQFREDLLIVMRVYFEKPRTTVGWKGLINDPNLDDSFAINDGLRAAPRFLLNVLDLGLPTGTEFLDPITPQFIADLVCWGAIGARTSESQVHRELASGLSMPVGFKNGTDGTVQVAIDAIGSSLHPHRFLSVTKQSVAAIIETRGNDACHVILRGGSAGPNYGASDVAASVAALAKASLPTRVMVDCSHANSGKDHTKQPDVIADVSNQVAGGDNNLFGVMIESFLKDGNQPLNAGKDLRYGVSVTDKCMSWERTQPLFEVMAQAVRDRRKQAK